MGVFRSGFIKTAILSLDVAIILFIIQQGFQFDVRYFFTGPGSLSRIILFCITLTNLKSAPLIWHARLLGAVFRHKSTSGPRDKNISKNIPGAVFQPIITSSHSPLAECDINLHKSNATFFSDLDITRAQLLSCLFTEGVEKLRVNEGLVFGRDGNLAKGPVNFFLGATQCSFKREIKPYQSYEMWSRVLTWDNKWLYVITHFVAKGAVRPTGYVLAGDFPGATSSDKDIKTGKKSALDGFLETLDGKMSDKTRKAVFASAISKQVVKLGRITVDPEILLTASGLLPPKSVPPTTIIPLSASSGTIQSTSPRAGHTKPNPAECPEHENKAARVWESVERRRQRGMEYAAHFAALDGLIEEFSGERMPAYGVFSDLW